MEKEGVHDEKRHQFEKAGRERYSEGRILVKKKRSMRLSVDKAEKKGPKSECRLEQRGSMNKEIDLNITNFNLLIAEWPSAGNPKPLLDHLRLGGTSPTPSNAEQGAREVLHLVIHSTKSRNWAAV